MAKNNGEMTVETLKHVDDTRKNIPTAEYQAVLQAEDKNPVRVAFDRRNRDLDPQLVWRGKDEKDWSDLVVSAPPLYIQEKVHPKVLIDDLLRQTKSAKAQAAGAQTNLFADFNGVPKDADKTDFYHHDQNWTNRMILGDSLQVMASLAEREGLRGQVQCIYFDPPYGIKFNSNFQWSTTSRTVTDGKSEHITREPEQVKAFRDTWRDGIHSYLSYLRDRLTVARDLLADSGSIFVQIGDENAHRVRAVLDEVFGEENMVSSIIVQKTGGQSAEHLASVADHCLWYAKKRDQLKYRQLFFDKAAGEGHGSGARYNLTDEVGRAYRWTPTVSNRPPGSFPVPFRGRNWLPSGGYWKTSDVGFSRLIRANRIGAGRKTLQYKRFIEDFPAYELSNIWTDVAGTSDKIYVVQTASAVVQRCILMSTDPGDLVLDPTCGSGTTAQVAEQWGRRWITIDTSRVALALARARIMGGRHPYYLLADSLDGQVKEGQLSGKPASTLPACGRIRQGFVYDRIRHVQLKSIANNAEIDVIWEAWEEKLIPLLSALNATMSADWHEWQVPVFPETPWADAAQDVLDRLKAELAREGGKNQRKIDAMLDELNTAVGRSFKADALPPRAADPWPEPGRQAHAAWCEGRTARQLAIDACITGRAEFEYLFDRPHEDKRKVRVAGPFTVESISPHRTLGVDENDELIDPLAKAAAGGDRQRSFPEMILENLKVAGVQQAHKDDRIDFTAINPWPGDLVCADGRYLEGDTERRGAIFIGPEFGTVTRTDLVAAAKEAAEAGFDSLIACAFSYEAHATEFTKLGRLPVLKARMNADLHMATELKATGKGNLFVIFGEPDIVIDPMPDKTDPRVTVTVKGVDVFHPNSGEVRSDTVDGIACWFIDTDYNEESFFVRHAYFLGANDPYNALRTTLKAEINAEAWASLHSATSRPFARPASGRIAVKVINHLGDEVMKVFRV